MSSKVNILSIRCAGRLFDDGLLWIIKGFALFVFKPLMLQIISFIVESAWGPRLSRYIN